MVAWFLSRCCNRRTEEIRVNFEILSCGKGSGFQPGQLVGWSKVSTINRVSRFEFILPIFRCVGTEFLTDSVPSVN